jgi:hypothetical protein
MSLRLAPSVDNGVVGSLGQRELINRMQLVLSQIGIMADSGGTSPGKVLVKIILNGQPSSNATWLNVGGSSLCQYAFHGSNHTVSNGETIYSFFVTTVRGEAEVNTQDLAAVRDLGNSILGGGINNTLAANSRANVYPDGPDHVTIAVSNIGAVAVTTNARLGWTEAQA